MPPAHRSHSGVKGTCKPLGAQERAKPPRGPLGRDQGPTTRTVGWLCGRREGFSMESGVYPVNGGDRTGGRGGKAARHLETETQAVGAGGRDARTRDLARLGHCAISGPRITTGTWWESLNICRVSECQERSLRGYDRRLTGELDLGNRGLLTPPRSLERGAVGGTKGRQRI